MLKIAKTKKKLMVYSQLSASQQLFLSQNHNNYIIYHCLINDYRCVFKMKEINLTDLKMFYFMTVCVLNDSSHRLLNSIMEGKECIEKDLLVLMFMGERSGDKRAVVNELFLSYENENKFYTNSVKDDGVSNGDKENYNNDKENYDDYNFNNNDNDNNDNDINNDKNDNDNKNYKPVDSSSSLKKCHKLKNKITCNFTANTSTNLDSLINDKRIKRIIKNKTTLKIARKYGLMNTSIIFFFKDCTCAYLCIEHGHKIFDQYICKFINRKIPSLNFERINCKNCDARYLYEHRIGRGLARSDNLCTIRFMEHSDIESVFK